MSYNEMKTSWGKLEATAVQQQMWAGSWCVKASRLTRTASLYSPTFNCLCSKESGGTENQFPFKLKEKAAEPHG